mgnify:CR=1 FL=1
MPGRIRTIKPEFFLDEDIAALDPRDQLAFIGLWCYADKAGRLEYRPSRLAVEILPYHQSGFKDRLARLCAAGFILIYENESKPYIQIRTFDKHQKPHHTEAESRIPPIDESSVFSPSYNGETTEETQSKDVVGGYKTVVSQEGREGNRKGKGKDSVHRGDGRLDGFDEFWTRYPRHEGKGAAEHSWVKMSDSDRRAAVAASIEFGEKWTARPKEDRKFCPLPSTWLNGRRWEDEGFVEPPPPPKTPEEIAKDEERAYWAERLKASEEQDRLERLQLLAELKEPAPQKEA